MTDTRSCDTSRQNDLFTQSNSQANDTTLRSHSHSINNFSENFQHQIITESKMNNDDIPANNIDNLEDRFSQADGLHRFHWGADDQITSIIRARDNSPETANLVDRRTNLVHPGLM